MPFGGGKRHESSVTLLVQLSMRIAAPLGVPPADYRSWPLGQGKYAFGEQRGVVFLAAVPLCRISAAAAPQAGGGETSRKLREI